MTTAKVALSGDKPAPDWTDADKRMTMAAGLSNFDRHTGRVGQTQNLYERRAFDKAQDFVTKLTAAGNLPEEQRNDAVREALASRPRDSVAIATLVELLGRDVVDLQVKVDSNAGKKGTEYDFDFQLTGNEYDVQKTVFGANL